MALERSLPSTAILSQGPLLVDSVKSSVSVADPCHSWWSCALFSPPLLLSFSVLHTVHLQTLDLNANSLVLGLRLEWSVHFSASGNSSASPGNFWFVLLFIWCILVCTAVRELAYYCMCRISVFSCPCFPNWRVFASSGDWFWFCCLSEITYCFSCVCKLFVCGVLLFL